MCQLSFKSISHPLMQLYRNQYIFQYYPSSSCTAMGLHWLYSNEATLVRINSSSVHRYTFVFFIRNVSNIQDSYWDTPSGMNKKNPRRIHIARLPTVQALTTSTGVLKWTSFNTWIKHQMLLVGRGVGPGELGLGPVGVPYLMFKGHHVWWSDVRGGHCIVKSNTSSVMDTVMVSGQCKSHKVKFNNRWHVTVISGFCSLYGCSVSIKISNKISLNWSDSLLYVLFRAKVYMHL